MINKDRLSERKEKILKAVVDEYIKTAIPISSGEIKTKYMNTVSSATIRSELAVLENLGFLIKPHTSAGRIPSKKAYRFYVDKFLVKHSLKKGEIQLINDSFQKRFNEVEEIVKNTAKIISDITNYTSIIVLNNISKVKLKEIKLVGLDEHTALVVIITDGGIIRDKVINVSNELNNNYINDANGLLNKIFSGKTLSEIKNPEKMIQVELADFKELYENIIAILDSYSEKNNDVFLEGTSKMLDYPDYDKESAKNFLAIVDSKEKFAEIMQNNKDIEFSVKIGKEESGGLDNCAIVTAKYKINGKEIGHAGVIGPERMDYSKVVSVLSYVGKTLEEIVDGGKNE